jgi:hypothetical protein
MRKLLLLAVIGGIVYWFLNRRGGSGNRQSVTIGYVDGSAVTLEQGAPELDRLVQVASEALVP